MNQVASQEAHAERSIIIFKIYSRSSWSTVIQVGWSLALLLPFNRNLPWRRASRCSREKTVRTAIPYLAQWLSGCLISMDNRYRILFIDVKIADPVCRRLRRVSVNDLWMGKSHPRGIKDSHLDCPFHISSSQSLFQYLKYVYLPTCTPSTHQAWCPSRALSQCRSSPFPIVFWCNEHRRLQVGSVHGLYGQRIKLQITRRVLRYGWKFHWYSQ